MVDEVYIKIDFLTQFLQQINHVRDSIDIKISKEFIQE